MKNVYSTTTGTQKAALAFMIIAIFLNSVLDYFLFPFYKANMAFLTPASLYIILLLPLIWRIPMTIYYYKKIHENVDPIGCGFIAGTFLLISPIAAILMLIDR